MTATTVAMLVMLVPAFAASNPLSKPVSALGVVPELVKHTGGDWMSDCYADDVGSNADTGIWISNPKTGTYVSQTGIVVHLTVTAKKKSDPLLEFVVPGAWVSEAIIKGGVDSNVYRYNGFVVNGTALSGVMTDSKLGAPQTAAQDNLSHVSLCLDTKGSISGKKWRDHDNDGEEDGFERGLSGWTIKAFQDGTEVGAAVTLADGTYTIPDLPFGTYTVCEFAPPEAPGFDYRGWYQSTPTAALCGAIPGAEPSGRSVTIPAPAEADVTGIDFLNVRTITIPGHLNGNPQALVCDPDAEPFLSGDGVGTFTVGDGVIDPVGSITVHIDACKPGEYVFETYVQENGQQVADFYRLPEPPNDPTDVDFMPIVEDYIWVITGTRDQLTLKYDDILSDGYQPEPMKFCQKQWSPGDDPADVLPFGETSCLLETSEQATVDGVYRTDKVFTLIDGRRTLA